MDETGNEETSALTLRIKFRADTAEQFVERYGADLSSGGIFIRAREPLAVGTVLNFAFAFQDGTPGLSGAGTVVWIREPENVRAGAGQPGMGIRFDRLTGDSQGMLQRLLAEKARREREGGLIGTGGRPTPSPAALGSAPRRTSSVPVAVSGPERTARVSIDPLTGEPQRPSAAMAAVGVPQASAPPSPSGPVPAAPASAPRIMTPALGSVPVRRASASEPGRRPSVVGEAAAGSSANRTVTPPLGSAPTRRMTPAPSEPGRRGTLDPSRAPTPAMGVSRRTNIPTDTVRTRTPFPSEVSDAVAASAGGRWAPLDGPVMSPLEGALSSTVGGVPAEPLPSQPSRRQVERVKPLTGFEMDGEATEIARLPPEFNEGPGAVPFQASNAHDTEGSGDSKPTNPEIPLPRGQVAPGAAGAARGPEGSIGSWIAEAATKVEIPGPVPPVPVIEAPEVAQRSGGRGKLVVGIGFAAAAAIAGVLYLKSQEQPPVVAPTVATAPAVTPPPPPAAEPAAPGSAAEPTAAAPAAEPAAPAPAGEPAAAAAAPVAADNVPVHPTAVPLPDKAPAAEPAAAKPTAPEPPPPVVAAAKPVVRPAPPRPPVRRVIARPAAAKPDEPPVVEAVAAESPAAEPAPAAAPATDGAEDIHWLMVRSTPPGAEVLIDGEVEGKTPFQRRIFDISRSYAVTIRKAGFEPHDRTVTSMEGWVKKGNTHSLVVFAKLAKSKKPAAGEAPAEGAATEPPAEPKPAAEEKTVKDDKPSVPIPEAN